MQKPGLDKGFQRERDICLHFAHCPQLSNRFVFVFARVRPPRTRRRGARSNLGHCHPRHILGARQQELQKAAQQLGRGTVARVWKPGGGGGRRRGPSSCAAPEHPASPGLRHSKPSRDSWKEKTQDPSLLFSGSPPPTTGLTHSRG